MTAENKSTVMGKGKALCVHDSNEFGTFDNVSGVCWVCGKTASQIATVTSATRAPRAHKFELKRDGSVDRVGRFGSYGPTVEAGTKSEAIAKLLAFAFRAAENTPKVTIKNGAYQLAFESVAHGITVEAGIDSRKGALCISGEADWKSVTDETASFAYYASEEYQRTRTASL